jgi:hypothetical protein
MPFIDRIGIVKKYKNKLNNKFEKLEEENLRLATENIDLRLKLKKINHEKINVVFVCHRPAVWEALKTVYEALKKDDNFNVSIVAIPNKKELPKLGLNHEVYESEGAEDFWKSYGCINGYDYTTHKWFDLRKLNPDYVFFQQPYNITRCEAYKSWNVSRYARLLYVSYFGFVPGISKNEALDTCYPMDFIKDVSIYFSQTQKEEAYFKKLCEINDNVFTRVILTGYPKYDINDKCINADDYCFLWTPRWTTNENSCNFFDYKDKLIDFVRENDSCSLIFRPHPQMWQEFESTGEFVEKDKEKYLKRYEKSKRCSVDNDKDYINSFLSSNCLISDISSMIPQYFILGKPVIFCNHKNNMQSLARHEGISDGLYFAENWNEVEKYMKMLMAGNDPLKMTRKKIINNEFYNIGNAGPTIKNIILEDASK